MSDEPGSRLGAPHRGQVLNDKPERRFFVSDLDGAPRWVGGMLAGLQAALLSLLVVVVPAIAAYVATSSAPAAADVSWTQAVRIGSGIWLLAHGVPLSTAPSVTLAPLGLTALAIFISWASARRSGYATRGAWVAGMSAYVAVLVVVGLLVGVPLLHLGIGVFGGAAVAGIGLGAGLLRRPEAPRFSTVLHPVRSRLPEPVAQGIGAGVVSLFALLTVAALLTALWALAGSGAITEVVRGLQLDVIGGLVLAVGELAFLPNLVLWALSWLAGPGFAVGSGTSITGGSSTAGALPAVPILGALPAPDVAGGVLVALPVVMVFTALVAVVWLRRRLDSQRALDPIIAGGVAAGVSGVGALALAALARGGIGPGRMSEFGPNPWAVAFAVAAGTAVAMVLVLLPGDRHVRSALRSGVRRLIGGIRRRETASGPKTLKAAGASTTDRGPDTTG